MPHLNAASSPRPKIAHLQPSSRGLPLVRFPWWSRALRQSRQDLPKTADRVHLRSRSLPEGTPPAVTGEAEFRVPALPKSAGEIMSAPAVTVGPKTDVGEVAKTLVRNGLSAVPVVDKDGRPLGMVSEGDLLRRPEIGTERRAGWWADLLLGEAARLERVAKEVGARAEHVMSAPAITIEEDASLAEIAETFERKRIRRLPVIRNGRIAGIVSRSDLLRALSFVMGARAPVQPTDEQLRRDVMDRIAELTADHWFINATVEDGMVELTGLVASPALRRAVVTVAESTPGALEVRDRMVRRPLARH